MADLWKTLRNTLAHSYAGWLWITLVLLQTTHGAERIFYFEDSSRNLNFAEIPTSSWIEVPLGQDLNPGPSLSAFWLKIQTQANNSDTALQIALLSSAVLDSVDCYRIGRGIVEHHVAGDRLPFLSRTIPVRNPAFAFTPGETLYLRIASYDGFQESIALSTMSAEQFTVVQARALFGFGAYFGLLAFITLFGAFLGIAFRDKAQIFFVLYLIFFIGWDLVFHGFADQFLWPSTPWSNQATMILSLLFSCFLTIFAREFLKLRTTYPRIDKTLGLMLLGLWSYCLPCIYLDAYRNFFLGFLSLTIVACVLVLYAASRMAMQRQADGMIFLASWSILLVGSILYCSKALGLIGSNAFTENAFMVGMIFQAVVLSIGFALRLLFIQERANLQLESIVQERTQELENANRQLTITSSLDPLTGLSNRRHFFELFTALTPIHERNHHPLTLIIADVDYFKQYNDTLGHIQGDHCLKRIAACLEHSLPRKSDFCARYGGEEFIICLPETNAEGAVLVAERIINAIRSLAIEHPASLTASNITISLGLCVWNEVIPLLLEPLVECADQALYQAKHDGRDRWVLAK